MAELAPPGLEWAQNAARALAHALPLMDDQPSHSGLLTGPTAPSLDRTRPSSASNSGVHSARAEDELRMGGSGRAVMTTFDFEKAKGRRGSGRVKAASPPREVCGCSLM